MVFFSIILSSVKSGPNKFAFDCFPPDFIRIDNKGVELLGSALGEVCSALF
jgi:hypothetical protein